MNSNCRFLQLANTAIEAAAIGATLRLVPINVSEKELDSTNYEDGSTLVYDIGLIDRYLAPTMTRGEVVYPAFEPNRVQSLLKMCGIY